MVTFRNNNLKRNNFRRSDRNFKSTNERNKFGSSSFNSKENFTRKINVKNNHNISKLIEKYSNLAREALSNGDKILSENYFQHADHFTRIYSENLELKKNKVVGENENLENKDEKSIKDQEENNITNTSII